jgi:myosin-crossreactive antigen
MSSEPGLAGLTAAFYLVRDGQMKGEHVHVLEKLPIPGGSTDGIHDPIKASSCGAAARWITISK